MGNERGSSRKGKKSSEKPKQPQRGLGVAQLENIRLHAQFYHPNLHSPTHFNQEDMKVQAAFSSLPSPSLSYSSSPSASYVFPSMHNVLNPHDLYGRTNIIFNDPQLINASSWIPSTSTLEAQQFSQPNMTGHIMMNMRVEDSMREKRKKYKSRSMENGCQNSDSNETQELDLELRLSI